MHISKESVMSSRTNRLFQNVLWMPTYFYPLLERIDWPSLQGFLSSRFPSYFRHAISFICQLGPIVKAPDWLPTSLECRIFIIGTILQNLDFWIQFLCQRHCQDIGLCTLSNATSSGHVNYQKSSHCEQSSTHSHKKILKGPVRNDVIFYVESAHRIETIDSMRHPMPRCRLKTPPPRYLMVS